MSQEDQPMHGFVSAEQIARTAADVVGGPRQQTYGDKHNNHIAIAHLWNGYLRAALLPTELDASDVACMLALFKIARTLNGNFHLDNYIDAAGYAAIAGEIRQHEENME